MKSFLGRVLLVPGLVLVMGLCFLLVSFTFTKFNPKPLVITNSTPVATDELLYSGDLFFKMDNIDRFGGVKQSLYVSDTNGQHHYVSIKDITFNKLPTQYFEEFVTSVPKHGRFAFFYSDDIAPSPEFKTEYRSSHQLLVFDKEKKEIASLHNGNLIDNPYEFSPDYKYVAILQSQINEDFVGADPDHFVDIIDIATLELRSRYYVPKEYSLYAMHYSGGAGRADWDSNVWLSTSTYQIGLFKKDGSKNWTWREDAELRQFTVYPSFATARAVVPVSAKSLVTPEPYAVNNGVYLRMPDESWVPAPVEIDGVYGFVQGIADSVPYVIAIQGGMCDALFVLDRATLQAVPEARLPKGFPGYACSREDFIVSPDGEKAISGGQATLIVDLKTLRVLREESIANQKEGIENVCEVGAKTRWISNTQVVLDFSCNGSVRQIKTINLAAS